MPEDTLPTPLPLTRPPLASSRRTAGPGLPASKLTPGTRPSGCSCAGHAGSSLCFSDNHLEVWVQGFLACDLSTAMPGIAPF